jgi:hypothetical protein
MSELVKFLDEKGLIIFFDCNSVTFRVIYRNTETDQEPPNISLVISHQERYLIVTILSKFFI